MDQVQVPHLEAQSLAGVYNKVVETRYFFQQLAILCDFRQAHALPMFHQGEALVLLARPAPFGDHIIVDSGYLPLLSWVLGFLLFPLRG